RCKQCPAENCRTVARPQPAQRGPARQARPEPRLLAEDADGMVRIRGLAPDQAPLRNRKRGKAHKLRQVGIASIQAPVRSQPAVGQGQGSGGHQHRSDLLFRIRYSDLMIRRRDRMNRTTGLILAGVTLALAYCIEAALAQGPAAQGAKTEVILKSGKTVDGELVHYPAGGRPEITSA